MNARAGGFSMIELLVAVVVTAFGVMGVAALIAVSMRQQYVGSLQAQATLVAESMIDRMRSNVQGVWLGAYDGDYEGRPTLAPATCGLGAACDVAQRVARDRAGWSAELGAFLNDADGRIDCNSAVAAPAGRLLTLAPPFQGFCDLTIRFRTPSERGAAPHEERISWRFTP
jgi:type IV pilus modification protein PilV